MATRTIKQLELTKLAVGESDPGNIPGETAVGDRVTLDLASGRKWVIGRYASDIVIPDPPAASGFVTPITLDQDFEQGSLFKVRPQMFPGGHGFWSNVQANGGDLRAYTEFAMENGLPLHVNAIDPGNTALELTVRLASNMTAGDQIFLHHQGAGGSVSPVAVGDALDQYAVYAGYGRSTADLVNFDNEAGTVTNTNGAASEAGDQLNGMAARNFSSNATSALGYTGDADIITVTFLIKAKSFTNLARFFDRGNGHQLFTDGLGNPTYQRPFQTTNGHWLYGNSGLTLDTWVHMAVRHNVSDASDVPTVRRTSSPGAPSPNPTTTPTTPVGAKDVQTGEYLVGNSAAGNRGINAHMCQFRIFEGDRSDTFLAQEEANFLDPASVATAQAMVTL